MQKTIAIVAAVAVVGAVGASWWISRPADDDVFSACRESVVGTGVASIGGPLSLLDEDGKQVTEKDIFTKPTLLYFGYTFCPDVCPLDSARNAEAVDLLEAQGIDAQIAFVSIDPERDTPERMKEFVEYIHPKMLGLTGTMEQIRAASQAYKTYFKKEENADPEYYLVDHSTFTYLVLPEIGFVDFFKRDALPADMARRTACFIAAAK